MGPDPRGPDPLALHVPRLVREWASDPATAGEPHQSVSGSMLFSDVSGFTKLSERLARRGRAGAEAIAGIIDRCFTELIDEAYRYGGTLLQFGGDALLLFFPGDHHELRAAGAALAMRASLRETREDLPVVGRAPLSMTVGVHSGDFDFFLVGASHRQLVVGGPAASRLVELEEEASRGRILISAETAAALPSANVGVEEEVGIRLQGRLDPPAPTRVEFFDAHIDVSLYVESEIRQAVSRGTVHSEHRTATLAFVHHRGLDDVLAEHGPEEAAARLDALVVGVQEAIVGRTICFQSADTGSNGGKFYLTAGVPRSTGADEEAMLLALRDIVDLDVGLDLRAGVNSGPVFMGEIRTQHRNTFITMGDAVNLAARVTGKSEFGTVLSTQPVLDRSRTLFEETPCEPFMVKGKAKPVEATVVGPAKGVRPGIGAADLPIVGRDEELAAYAVVEADVLAGRGRFVEVVADAGAGKSRLLDEFEAHDDRLRFHRGRSRLYQSATPYFPFGELLREVYGFTGLPLGEQKARLRGLADTAGVADSLPLLGQVFGMDIDGAVPDDAEVRKSLLEQATVALLAATLTEPIALCMEDAHWMDDPSRDLLSALAGGIGTRPWLLLVAHRRSGGAIEAEPDLRLELKPLAPSAMVSLVRAATADAPMPTHVVDALVARSDGNPLFLLEMVNGVQSGADVESLPTSVEGLLTSRIDRLAPDDRALLRHLAVLGNEFDQRYVRDVVPVSIQAESGDALLRLNDFVIVDERGWVIFRHHLVRDVAYEGLPYRTRRQLHSTVAESVRERVGDQVNEVAPLLSVHYWRARRLREAWTYSVMAGDQAAAAYANADAVELYRRALSVAAQLRLRDSDVVDTLEKCGDVQRLAGLTEESRRSYIRARHLALTDPVTRARMELKTAILDDRLGRLTSAIRDLRRGERQLVGVDSVDVLRLRGQLAGWEASVRIHQGRLTDAREASRRAIDFAEPVEDRATCARAFLTLDYARWALGESPDLSDSRRALDIYTELRDLSGQASALNNLGVLAVAEERFEEAAGYYRRSRLVREQMGDSSGRALADANLAEVLIEQDDLDTADELLDEALAVWRAANDLGDVPFALQMKGAVAMRRGDLDAADELLAEAHEVAVEFGSEADVEEVQEARAELEQRRARRTSPA